MAGHKTTLDLLKEYNIRPQKSLGQNFLIDDNINRFIVEKLELKKKKLVLEIGAGLGELVNFIKDDAGLVLALEFDRGLSGLLQQRFKSEANVRVLNQDILECKLSALIEEYNFKQAVVVGNLPYYISSPIIFHLIKYRQIIDKAIIMLQKEVAQRIVAKAGGKDYGILSCLLEYYGKSKIIKVVKSNCFFPRPKVDSAIIELTFYKKPLFKVANEDLFRDIVKTTFSQRRKTISNTLTMLKKPSLDKQYVAKMLESIKINPASRPEQLSAAEFAKIANQLYLIHA
jgi:16S rRNA (adenine1518-N6/adenine1519-N6)-dimethyltransferase